MRNERFIGKALAGADGKSNTMGVYPRARKAPDGCATQPTHTLPDAGSPPPLTTAKVSHVSEPRYQFNISVQVRYLPDQSEPSAAQYAFAYTVTIVNTGKVAAQLISRHWIIRDEQDEVVEVKGLGVVGQQPFLKPGEKFEYTSGSRIATPIGTMEGSYFFVAEDGHRFDQPIAAFTLAVPRTLH
jgi:ApaG protein